MDTQGEHILLVETDPDVIDVIARQTLKPLGFQVSVAKDAGTAIQHAVQNTPDLIISNLSLPGLSGKDLLVAFTSRGIRAPVIVVTGKGNEQNLIQAFRLGASDYLLWPARDVEVVSVVERVLRQVKEGRARQQLDIQLKKSNAELNKHLNELKAIMQIGKAVLTINDQRQLFNQIIQGAVQVGQADMCWLLLRDEKNNTFILVAQHNLPAAWAKKINQPLDDNISGLVAMSGEALTFHGEPLKQFKVAALGQSVAVTPLKVKKDVIGILVVLRETDTPFTENEMMLLDTMADYASISLVNARLFKAIEASRPVGDPRDKQRLQSLKDQVHDNAQEALDAIKIMLSNEGGMLTIRQHQALAKAQTNLASILKLVSSENPLRLKK